MPWEIFSQLFPGSFVKIDQITCLAAPDLATIGIEQVNDRTHNSALLHAVLGVLGEVHVCSPCRIVDTGGTGSNLRNGPRDGTDKFFSTHRLKFTMFRNRGFLV